MASEQPKKCSRSKKSLSVGGALLTAAGIIYLAGEEFKLPEIEKCQAETHGRVEQMLTEVHKIKPPARLSIKPIEPTKTIKSEQERPEFYKKTEAYNSEFGLDARKFSYKDIGGLALEGDMEALNTMFLLNGAHWRDAEEYGMSPEQFKLLQRGFNIMTSYKSILESSNSPSKNYEEYEHIEQLLKQEVQKQGKDFDFDERLKFFGEHGIDKDRYYVLQEAANEYARNESVFGDSRSWKQIMESFDSQGKIDPFNPTFLRILGMTKEEVQDFVQEVCSSTQCSPDIESNYEI